MTTSTTPKAEQTTRREPFYAPPAPRLLTPLPGHGKEELRLSEIDEDAADRVAAELREQWDLSQQPPETLGASSSAHEADSVNP